MRSPSQPWTPPDGSCGLHAILGRHFWYVTIRTLYNILFVDQHTRVSNDSMYEIDDKDLLR